MRGVFFALAFVGICIMGGSAGYSIGWGENGVRRWLKEVGIFAAWFGLIVVIVLLLAAGLNWKD